MDGNHFDIGGHRFFTKYESVQALWEEVLGDEFISVPRLSRIYYDGKFFAYEWMRGWIMSVTLDAKGDMVSMERFMPSTKS